LTSPKPKNDSLTIRTVPLGAGTDLANASNTSISEVHYHPADSSQAEIDAGCSDPDLFEFIELVTTGAGSYRGMRMWICDMAVEGTL
jgi:hypothetical protein